MIAKSSLDSVIFISLPQNFNLPANASCIDPNIPLPVQKISPGAGFDIAKLTWEQILTGILTICAYDANHKYSAYYRTVLLAVKPNIREELTEAAILKTKNGDFDIAEEIFAALHGLDPDNMAIKLNMALFFDQKAGAHRKSNSAADADRCDEIAHLYYKQLMAAETAIPDAFFNAGFFYLERQNFARARECFETYLSLSVGTQSKDLEEQEAYKQKRAKEIVQNIRSRKLDDELFKSAYDFISMGQEEKGLPLIRSFLEKNPNVWNAWFMLGWALRRLERWEDAQSAFEQCLVCGGDNADTYNELSLCLLRLGEFGKGRKYLLKALELEPENTKIISNLGFLYLQKGDKEEARRYFTAVLEFDKGDRVALNALAELEK